MRRTLIAAAAVAASAALAAPASADIYDDFRNTGQVNPCNYSQGELQQGLQNLPPDIQQYSPGLADQLAAGREGCDGGAGGSVVTGDTRDIQALPGFAGGGGGFVPPAPTIAKPPAPKAPDRFRFADVDSPAPAPAAAALETGTPGWLLAVLAAVLLGALAAAVIRFTGWSADGLARPLGASFADARDRVSDGFAGLADSVRGSR